MRKRETWRNRMRIKRMRKKKTKRRMEFWTYVWKNAEI